MKKVRTLSFYFHFSNNILNFINNKVFHAIKISQAYCICIFQNVFLQFGVKGLQVKCLINAKQSKGVFKKKSTVLLYGNLVSIYNKNQYNPFF